MKTQRNTIITLGLGIAGTSLCDARRTETAQSTPAAIAAVDRSSIEQSRVLDISSLSTLRTSTIRETQVLIRPRIIETNSADLTIRGVSLDQAANPQLTLPAMERIEVLRGPQGVLFGRDQTSGFSGFISAGHTGNKTHDPFNGESSGVITAGLSYQHSLDLGSGKLDLGVAAALTYYDNAFDGWPGDDRYLHDFSAYLTYTQQLSQSAQLDVNVALNYGDHGSIPRGFNWAGALQNPVFDFNADAEVTWRTDGLDLTAPGLVLRSGIQLGGYDEKDSDFADSLRYSISQEFIYLRDTNKGLYLRTELGKREFEEMGDYDSTYFGGTIGFFHPLPCGTELRSGVGFENIDYNGSNLDDRSDLTAELLLSGNIGKGRFSAGAQYGTFRNFVNWGGGNGVDMRGLQIGGRVTHPLTDKTQIRFSLESSRLHAASSDNADGTLSFQRASIGAAYQWSDNTTIDVITGLNRSSVDNGGNSTTDTYPTFNLILKTKF